MKYNFKKYRYLGAIAPEVPETWKSTIFAMVLEIDKSVRPWYVPLFILNNLSDKRVKNIIGDTKVLQIKQKFATLRVYGIFSPPIQLIVNAYTKLCDNTCESCGATPAKSVIIKRWIRTLCPICEEKLKI
jgi:hypothetical protein